jgi:hypothetical protein
MNPHPILLPTLYAQPMIVSVIAFKVFSSVLIFASSVANPVYHFGHEGILATDGALMDTDEE